MRTVKPLMNQSFIAKLLVLCMVLSLLPVSAFATDSNNVACNDNDNDADDSVYYAIKEDVTIGDVTLGSDPANDVYYIYADATADNPKLTLAGTTLNYTLYVGTDGTDSPRYAMKLSANDVKLNGALSIWPNVTILNLTFDYNRPAVATVSLPALGEGTVTLHGENGKVANVDGDIDIPAGITLKVEGGELVIPAGKTLTIAGKIEVAEDATVTIEAGAKVEFKEGSTAKLNGNIVVADGAEITGEPTITGDGDIVDQNVVTHTIKMIATPDNGTVVVTYTDDLDNEVTAVLGTTGLKLPEGTEVTITVNPDPEYEVKDASYTLVGSGETEKITDSVKIDLMDDVTVSAEFDKVTPPTPPPVVKDETYTITADAVNGTVVVTYEDDRNNTVTTVVDKNGLTLKAGTELKVTLNPDEGCTLNSAYYTIGDDTEQIGIADGDTITLNDNVAIYAEFTEEEKPPVEPEVPDTYYTIKADVEFATVEVTYKDDNGNTVNAVVGKDGVTLKEGTKVTITVKPADGYTLDKATYTIGDDAAVEFTGTVTIDKLTGNVTISAEITKNDEPTPPPVEEPTYYKVTADAVVNGTVEVTYEDDHGNTVNAVLGEDGLELKAGTKVTITVKPADGYTLKNATYTIGDDAAVEFTGTVTIDKLTGNVTISAEFTKNDEPTPPPVEEPEVYTVKAGDIANGTVEVTYEDDNGNTVTAVVGEEGLKFKEGTKVTITVKPDEGYYVSADSTYTMGGTTVKFATEDGEVGKSVELTIDALTGDVTVSAVFTKQPTPPVVEWYDVKVDADPENGTVGVSYVEAGEEVTGTLTVSEFHSVEEGTNVTITLDPDDGYYVDAESYYTIGEDTTKHYFVTEDGEVDENVELTIEVTGDVTIHAVFEKKTTPVVPSGGSISPTVLTKTSEHGTFTVSNRYASVGQTVTVTPKADEGYVVEQVIVTDKNGKAVEVKDNGDGTYSFVMPESSTSPVTVSVTFVCDGGDHCVSKDYIDVDQSAWYHKYVDYVVEKGLMLGTSENTFDPEGTMTRAMLATVLWRLEGKPEAEGSTFTDVPADEWYSEAVAWAFANGIVDGYGDGTFAPEKAVSREEMVAMFYRYAKYKGYDLTATDDLSKFTDAGDVNFAVEAMQWAVGSGLINGRTADTIVPDGESTRAEVAAVLTRFCENIVK